MTAAVNGLAGRLRTIPGLRVVGFEPQKEWSEFPLAVVRLARRSAGGIGLSGASFEAELTVTVFVPDANPANALTDLYDFMETDGNSSIEAAVAEDPTLGGAVDDARLVEVVGIATRTAGGVRCGAADFRIRVIVGT